MRLWLSITTRLNGDCTNAIHPLFTLDWSSGLTVCLSVSILAVTKKYTHRPRWWMMHVGLTLQWLTDVHLGKISGLCLINTCRDAGCCDFLHLAHTLKVSSDCSILNEAYASSVAQTHQSHFFSLKQHVLYIPLLDVMNGWFWSLSRLLLNSQPPLNSPITSIISLHVNSTLDLGFSFMCIGLHHFPFFMVVEPQSMLMPGA